MMRSVGLGTMAALMLTLACGCKKSDSTESGPGAEPQPKTQVATIETVGRLHWLGKKKLAADTNAVHFLSIWNLPEGARLQEQTLDKLATAIASGFSYSNVQTAATTQPSPIASPAPAAPTPPPLLSPTASLLRPLLADLIEEESYLEIGSGTPQPGEALLAVRLNPERAVVWETNLVAVLNSLVGVGSLSAGGGYAWDLSQTNPPASASHSAGLGAASLLTGLKAVRLDRAGDWTVLSVARGGNSPLLSNVLARIVHERAPFTAPATNFWVDTAMDLPGVARTFAFKCSLPANWPKIELTMNGEGENVRSRGLLEFPQPLNMELQPWNMPTNLIHDPLIAFSAVRGIGPFLKSLSFWSELGLKTSPDQIYVWSQGGMPVLEYLAAPWPGASNAVQELAAALQKKLNPWLASNTMGQLTNSSTFNALIWENAPFVTPQLRCLADETGEVALLGLMPLVRTNLPPPQDLLQEFVGHTNWIDYAWEITGPKLEQNLYVSQLARLTAHRAQLRPDSASLQWLKAAGPKLGNCVTVVSRASPNWISFTRKSSFGFDSTELHLAADWLESPEFPLGLHTTLTPASSGTSGAR